MKRFLKRVGCAFFYFFFVVYLVVGIMGLSSDILGNDRNVESTVISLGCLVFSVLFFCEAFRRHLNIVLDNFNSEELSEEILKVINEELT